MLHVCVVRSLHHLNIIKYKSRVRDLSNPNTLDDNLYWKEIVDNSCPYLPHYYTHSHNNDWSISPLSEHSSLTMMIGLYRLYPNILPLTYYVVVGCRTKVNTTPFLVYTTVGKSYLPILFRFRLYYTIVYKKYIIIY